MGDKTGISWTDASWNPIRGCTRVSEGCRHCYAETTAARFCGPGQPYEGLVKITAKVKVLRRDFADGSMELRKQETREARWNGEIRFVADDLADPLKWKKPRRIFVNSMSDMFHEKLTNEQIAAIFGVMAAAPQHTFQVLTKRAKRMREWFEWLVNAVDPFPAGALDLLDEEATARLAGHYDVCHLNLMASCRWPLPNVWLGVSVENQAAADERIPELLRTPAAVRFLSCEPLLGPVQLPMVHVFGAEPKWDGPRIDWVITGCESGPRARPCEVEWLRSLRDQCAEAGTAFFLKQAKPQLGASTLITTREQAESRVHGKLMGTIPIIGEGPGSKRKTGSIIELPYLDGVQHAEFPRAGDRAQLGRGEADR